MKRYSAGIAIITILLSACCPMVSVNPLSAPAELDKRLEGVWKYDSRDDEEVYLHIAEKSENTMVALSVEHKKSGNLDIIKIPFFLTRTNTNNYLNVRLEDLEREVSEGNEGFIFIKYVFIDKNTLLFFQLDSQLIIPAIQTEKLKGKITYNKKIVPQEIKNNNAKSYKTVDCVIITDTSKNILNFVEAGNNDELFPDAKKFIKVN